MGMNGLHSSHRVTYGLLLSFLSLLGPARADSPCDPRVVGGLGGKIVELVPAESSVVALLETGEVQLLDRENFEDLGALHWLNFEGHAREVDVAHGHVLVSTTSRQIHIFDIRDPHQPRQVYTLNLPSSIQEISLAGRRAWILIHPGQLLLLDWTDPARPETLGTLEFSGTIRSVKSHSGSVAFLGQEDLLHLVTLDEDSVLRSPAQFVTDEGFRDLLIQGDRLFLLTRGGSLLHAFSIEDPEFPILGSQLELDASADRIHGFGDRVIATGSYRRTQIIDFEDLDLPRKLEIPRCSGDHSDFLALGSRGYFPRQGDQRLDQVELSSLEDPGKWEEVIYGRFPRSVALDGHHLYLGRQYGGIDLFDLSRLPALEPLPLPWLPLIGDYTQIRVQNDRAYLLDWRLGLEILDVSHPESPVHLAWYLTGGPLQVFSLLGNLVLLPDLDHALRVIDVRDSTAPALVSTLPIGQEVSGIWISGSLAFLAIPDFGLKVVELTHPEYPRFIGELRLPRERRWNGSSLSITGRGTRVFLGTRDRGLDEVDVSDPRNPVLIIPSPEAEIPGIRTLQAQERRIHATTWSSRVLTIDVSIPGQPRIVSESLLSTFRGTRILVSESRAFVVTDRGTLRVLDLTGCEAEPPRFLRGDTNDDVRVDLADAILGLEVLFQTAPAPSCRAALDVNADGNFDVSDPIISLRHQFLGTPAIAPPYPHCGPEGLPEDLALSCEIAPEGCSNGL